MSESRTAGTLLLAWAVATAALWGLAFYPANAAEAGLLVRAQVACFGRTPGGLPEPYGWMLLVLAPGSFVAALLAVYRAELRALWVRARHTPVVAMALLAGTGALMAEAHWVGGRIAEARRVQAAALAPFAMPESLPESYPRTHDPLPEFSLVDQHGAQVNAQSLTGQVTLLTFVFAHCQTMCPTLVKTLKDVRAELGPTTPVAVALITLDPWRDTPAALPSLVKPWGATGPQDRVLSGTPEQVNAALDAFGVARSRDGKNGDVGHAPVVMVVDAQGKVAYRFNGPPVEWLATAVQRLGGSTS